MVNNTEHSEGAGTSLQGRTRCSEAVRVEYVDWFAKGQHISMPGQILRKYNVAKGYLKHTYKHHAIVRKVKSVKKTTVEMEFIHLFNHPGDSKLKIRETPLTFDLRKDEIYHVRYQHSGYEPDEIVKRAESQLWKDGTGKSQFESYNLITGNCEHFATWCVVGAGESFQAKRCGKWLTSCVPTILGIMIFILRSLFNSAEATAHAFSSAEHVPEYVFIGTTGMYVTYCLGQNVRYRIGNMCSPCYKGKRADLWLGFGTYFVTSNSSYHLFHACWISRPTTIRVIVAITLATLSVILQITAPKIRRSLQSPFNVDRNVLSNISLVDIGDVISFGNYFRKHIAIVTKVNNDNNSVRCVYFSRVSLLTCIVKEETITLDASFKRLDCSKLECKPKEEVVNHAKKRVNETKRSLRDLSGHLCYWAKLKAKPGGPCEFFNTGEKSDSILRTSAFIRYDCVHLMTDLQLRDVVVYGRKGILVKKRSLDQNYGRRFEIEMIVYSSSCYVRKRKYKIDLNKHDVKIKIYHPAHCYPKQTRVDRAKAAMKDKIRNWWWTEHFIMHCIIQQ